MKNGEEMLDLVWAKYTEQLVLESKEIECIKRG